MEDPSNVPDEPTPTSVPATEAEGEGAKRSRRPVRSSSASLERLLWESQGGVILTGSGARRSGIVPTSPPRRKDR